MSRTEIHLGKFPVGVGHRPLVVAEMSGNHRQSLERALEIVRAAGAAGAHAIKLQTYTADTLTLNLHHSDFLITDENSLWKGRSLYALYEEAHTPWEWHKPIFELAASLGMICFSTPFDESSVDFLISLDVPALKIASFENTHLPLIRRAASTGKPLILSTGMATLAELSEAVDTARTAGCKDIILLKCTSTYPATPHNSNILTIPHLRETFNCEVGLSDHTLGTGVPIASVAVGATIIEKHFTIRRSEGGVDSAFSIEPDELKQLVVETGRAWEALGHISYGVSVEERPSLVFRRSLFISQDMKAGDKFTPNNLRIIRPGSGLPPRYFDMLIGRSIKRDVKLGTPVTWDLLL